MSLRPRRTSSSQLSPSSNDFAAESSSSSSRGDAPRKAARPSLLLLLLLLLVFGGAISAATYASVYGASIRPPAPTPAPTPDPFEIRSRHTLLLRNTLVPEEGDHDVITIVLENGGNTTLHNVTVEAEVLSSVIPSPPPMPVSVLCPPNYTHNMVHHMAPGAKVMCKALYMLTALDVEQLAILTAITTATPPMITNTSSIHIEDNAFVVTPNGGNDDGNDSSFVHGYCANATEPPLVCDTAHYTWTFLCIDQQILVYCNESGWTSYFELELATDGDGNAYSLTSMPFTQPACGMSVMIHVESTAWMAVGQVIFIEGGGYYIVTSITDGMMVTVTNPCFNGNAVDGDLIGTTPAAVVPAGQEGPPGPTGPTGATGGTGPEGPSGPSGPAGESSISAVMDDFVQPVCNDHVTVTVFSTTWMSPGMIIYVGNAGYFVVAQVLSPTMVDLINTCSDGNAISGTLVPAGNVITPAGAPGPSGATGATGATGSPGSTGATGPSGGTGADGETGSPGPTGGTGAGGTGAQGGTGGTGPQGGTGAQGGTGGTGSPGPTGATGADATTQPAFTGNADFVAVGNVISYSIDGGYSFTPIQTNFFTFSYDVAYSRPLGIWIAVGSGSNTAVYSTNGYDWFTSPLNIVFSQGNAIAWSDTANIFVAGGQGTNKIATSADGSLWTVRSTPFTTAVFGVAYAKERARWVAVGQGTAAIAYSSDNGVTWVQAMAQVSGIVGKHVTWAPEIGTFLVTLSGATGGYVSTAVSGNGIAWALDANAFQSEAATTGSAWNGTHFYVTGISAANTIMSSTDGRAFTGMGTSQLTTTGLGVCWGANYSRWVVLGTGGNGPIFTEHTAGNGSHTQFPAGYILGTRCVARYTTPETGVVVTPGPAVQAQFVSVGQGESSIAYQLTGEAFHTPVGVQHLTTSGNDVAYSTALNMWIAVGSGSNRGAMSTNGGVTWTTIPSLNTALSTAAFAIAWSDEEALWVAGGSGTNKIATSPDGVTWTARASPFATQVNGIAYSNQRARWVAVGTGGCAVAYSSDGGVTWTQAIGVVSGLAGTHVTWSFELELFLVTFSGNPLSTATSINGLAWSMNNAAFQPNAVVTGVAWNGTQFIASGTSNADTLQSSTNGIAFTGLAKTALSVNGRGVCFGTDYNMWTFTGTGTNVISTLSSTTGTTGYSRPFSTQANRCAARYSTPKVNTLSPGPNQTVDFVVVGQGESALAYTLTGDRWYTSMGLAMFSTSASDVAYSPANNTWIAVGTGTNRGAISTNGFTWLPLPSLTAALSTSGLAVARSDPQNLWVAGGAGTNKIATSSDGGITWVPRASPFTTQVNGIAYSNERNRWVAVGSGTCAIAYSNDGTTWIQLVAVVSNIVGRHVTWAPEAAVFLATLSGGPATYPSTATSVNGIAWSMAQTAFQPAANANGAAWNGTQFMVTGASATDTIQSSTNGLTFSSLGNTDLAVTNGVCYSPLTGEWLFAGNGATNNVYSLSSTTGLKEFSSPFSTLASRCAARTNVVPFTLDPGPVVPVDFMVTGSGQTSLAYSIHGRNKFTPVGLAQFSVSAADVAYSPVLESWLAVGTGTNAGAYSVDGYQWTATTGLTALMSNALAVARSDPQGLWVVGGSGMNKIATSPDAFNWTARTTPFTTQVNSIAYSRERDRWVAVGSGACAIAYSNDGITWVQLVAVVSNVVGRHVTWSTELGLFVASLSGGPATWPSTATSVNGIAWSMNNAAFQTASVTTGAAWNGTLLMLTGSSSANTIQSSTDGLTFSGMGNSDLASANGVCYGPFTNTWLFTGTAATNAIYALSAVTGTKEFSSVFTASATRCAGRMPISSFTLDAGPAVSPDFMVMGTGQTSLAYSIHGRNKFTPVGLAQFSTSGADVAYSPALAAWLAVGAGTNAGAYSTDGYQWTATPGLTAIMSSALAVARSDYQGLWVVGGPAAVKIATSPDGFTWTARAAPFTTQVNAIAYSRERNRWVAVGSGTAAVAYSNDGFTWLQSVAVVSSVVGRHVAWAPELGLFLVSLSGGVPGSPSIVTSVNGAVWSMAKSAFQPTANVVGAAWNGTQFLLTGSSTVPDTIQSSADGFTFVGEGAAAVASPNGVCFGPLTNNWLVAGNGATNSIYVRSSLSGASEYYSVFTTSAARCAARVPVTSFTLDAGPPVPVHFVATGAGGTTISYSINAGASFTPIGFTLFSTSAADVAHSPALNSWFAVGAGTNIGGYSTNGADWTAAPNLAAVLTTALAVARSDPQNLWVVGGTGATSRIATSPDGFTWTARASPFTTQVNGIAYSRERARWVAVGSGTCAVAYSNDGINWVQSIAVVSNVVGRHVEWAADIGLFLVGLSGGPVGYPSTATSVNGIAWNMGQSAFQPTAHVNGVAWNGTRFMLTGVSTTDTIQTSSDGFAFTGLGNLAVPAANGVCYSTLVNKWLFLQTHSANSAYTLSATSNTSSYWTAFTTNGNRCAAQANVTSFTPSAGPTVQVDFVATGTGGSSLAYSINAGNKFTPIGLIQFSTSGADVAYSPALNAWFAVGAGTNAGAYSTDGIAWTISTGLTTFMSSATAVARSDAQGLWVVGGSSAAAIKIATSPDAITWTPRASPITTQVNGIVYSNERARWVAVGSSAAGGAAVAYSNDAITWIQVVGVSANAVGRHVAWASELGRFLVTLSGGSVANPTTTATSTDGIGWEMGVAAFQVAGSATGVAWNGTQFMITGLSTPDSIMTSTDAYTFTGRGKTELAVATGGNGVCYGVNTSKWVFTQTQSTAPGMYTLSAADGSSVYGVPFSTQGTRCAGTRPIDVFTPSAGPVVDVAFVAMGQGDCSHAYSINGGNTFTPAGGYFTAGSDVAFSPQQNLWVSVGSGGNRGMTSTDGIAWTNQPSFAAAISTAGLAVVWNDVQNQWVAGGSGTNKIATSPDGVTWTARASGFTTQVNGLAYSPERNRWVAVGTGTVAIAYSSDNATTWTSAIAHTANVGGRSVIWSSSLGMFIATMSGGVSGATSIMTSVNGIGWITHLSAFQPTAVATGIAWNGTIFLLTGTSTNDTIQSTTDGLTYASRGKTGLTVAGNGLCFGHNYSAWVFVGSGTSVTYTESSLTGATLGRSNPFVTQGNRCAGRNYNTTGSFVVDPGPVLLADFVVVGTGGAHVAYSLNGGLTFAPSAVGLLPTAANDVAYSRTQQLWIVSSSHPFGSHIMSGDGINWIPGVLYSGANNPCIERSDTQNIWVACVYSGVSNALTYVYSSDAISWFGGSTPNTFGNIQDIVYSPERNLWVQVTNAGYIHITSNVAGGWTTVSTPQGYSFNRILWLPELGQFIAFTNGGGFRVSTATSYDGIAWTAETNAFQPQANAASGVWNGTKLYAIGASTTDTIQESSDALNFVGLGSPFISSPADGCYGAEYGRWVFTGSGSSTIVSMSAQTGVITRTNAFSSTGGKCAARFTVVPTPVVPPVPAYNADFVVGGTGTGSIAYSLTGGRTFIVTTKLSFSTSGNDVAYSASQTKWIMVGIGSQGGMSSSNGVTWSNIGGLTSVLGGTVLGVARSESQDLWIAGGNGANKLATSPDGVTWTARATPFTTQVNSITYSKTLGTWVAVGAGTTAIATSFDGIVWNQTLPIVDNAQGQHVMWAEELGLFFVSFNGASSGGVSAATSPDGLIWNTTSLVFQPSATNYGGDWDGSTMWLGGLSSLNTQATSTNGVTFTGQGNTLFTVRGTGACYGREYGRWQVLGGSSNSGYTFSNIGGPTLLHRHFSSSANRCTARYVNATT